MGAGAILSSLFIAFVFAPENTLPNRDLETVRFDFSEIVSNEQNKINPEEHSNVFDDLDITAKSVIVWDIKDQKALFEHNADESMPLASITKTLMALTVHDLLPANTEVVIEKEFLEAEGDTGLYQKERWIAKDLIEFTLITSSNDGARALASTAGSITLGTDNYEAGREFFIKEMNRKAQDLGLESIVVTDESGLDIDDFRSGAYSSARDLTIFFEKLLKNNQDILTPTTLIKEEFTSLSGIKHEVENTNLILDKIPGIMASKTGFTDLAGGNLVVIFDNDLGKPIIIVVLGSNFQGRFDDVEKLVEAVRKVN
jgi:D-alanyl-D-alanine carboxypeptidase